MNPRAVLAALLALPALVACAPDVDTPALVAVVGRWTTADERYAERSFELTADERLRLEVGPGEFEEHPLDGVEAERRDRSRTAYVVTYTDPEGIESEFRFDFVGSDETIRFANQPGLVWTREAR